MRPRLQLARREEEEGAKVGLIVVHSYTQKPFFRVVGEDWPSHRGAAMAHAHRALSAGPSWRCKA
eukprot:scaffold3545_cov126-Isochrysis_galbana.AAC.1